MATHIRSNLVFLSNNLTNLNEVLLHLYQSEIITRNEMEEVKAGRSSQERNSSLWLLLPRKDIDNIFQEILQILSVTGNGHLVNLLEGSQNPIEEAGRRPSFDSISVDQSLRQNATAQNAGNTESVNSSPIGVAFEDLRQTAEHNDISNADGVIFPSTGDIVDGPARSSAMSISLFEKSKFSVVDSGVFGLVIRAFLNEDQKYYAIKVTEYDIHREVDALSKLSHENIITYYNSWNEENLDPDMLPNFAKYPEANLILMELCEGNDLSVWVKRSPTNKTVVHAQCIIFQISLGVEYLHSKDVIHRDLKPANMLLYKPYNINENNLVVKITDFGYARSKHQESKKLQRSLMTKSTGTPLYCSPEQEENLDRYVFPYSTDIFSLGMIFYEILRSTQRRATGNELNKLRSEKGADMHSDFYNVFKEHTFIRKMLDRTPDRRPNSVEVVSFLKEKGYRATSE